MPHKQFISDSSNLVYTHIYYEFICEKFIQSSMYDTCIYSGSPHFYMCIFSGSQHFYSSSVNYRKVTRVIVFTATNVIPICQIHREKEEHVSTLNNEALFKKSD